MIALTTKAGKSLRIRPEIIAFAIDEGDSAKNVKLYLKGDYPTISIRESPYEVQNLIDRYNLED